MIQIKLFHYIKHMVGWIRMVKLFIVIFCMCLIPLFLCEKAEDSLILTHVFARHGNRTAEMDFIFPTYPLNPTSFYPYGAGELTLAGKKLMAAVGKALRGRYRDFIGDCYSHGLVEAISSGYKRTMMSLQLILAGLFVPSDSCVLKGNLNWQPVPFLYLPLNKDKFLAAHRSCPDILDVQTNTTEEDLELYKYLSIYSGMNITNSYGTFSVFWSIQNLLDLGYEAPEWSVPVWPQLLRELEGTKFYVDLVDQKMKKLTGSLIVKIHENVQNKINGNFIPKMVIYSAHDINMAGLLGACGIFKKEYISYGSYLIIELHKIEAKYYVKVLYENYKYKEPEVMNLPGCSEFCEIEKFVEYSRKFYPNEIWCP